MRYVQLGFSRWFTPLAFGPGHPELSKSCSDVASKLFISTNQAGVKGCTRSSGARPPGTCIELHRKATKARTKRHRPGTAEEGRVWM